MTSDLFFINESFSLAQKAYDLQEVPVGCVFVFDGLIIGRGHNEVNKTKNPTRHAEFVAIDQASDWCCENGKDFQELVPEVCAEKSISLLKKFYDRENPFAPLDKRKVKMEM
uniref:CMP/dCMP-type deaminase domain-containing protein n=1 Tax=Meloidogyne javanica TaxID=6303 RepID=A0A915MSQ0_MELJA